MDRVWKETAVGMYTSVIWDVIFKPKYEEGTGYVYRRLLCSSAAAVHLTSGVKRRTTG